MVQNNLDIFCSKCVAFLSKLSQLRKFKIYQRMFYSFIHLKFSLTVECLNEAFIQCMLFIGFFFFFQKSPLCDCPLCTFHILKFQFFHIFFFFSFQFSKLIFNNKICVQYKRIILKFINCIENIRDKLNKILMKKLCISNK